MKLHTLLRHLISLSETIGGQSAHPQLALASTVSSRGIRISTSRIYSVPFGTWRCGSHRVSCLLFHAGDYNHLLTDGVRLRSEMKKPLKRYIGVEKGAYVSRFSNLLKRPNNISIKRLSAFSTPQYIKYNKTVRTV